MNDSFTVLCFVLSGVIEIMMILKKYKGVNHGKEI